MPTRGAVPGRRSPIIDTAIAIIRSLLDIKRFHIRPQQIIGLGHALLGWERLPAFIDAVEVEVILIAHCHPLDSEGSIRELRLLISPQRAKLRLTHKAIVRGEPGPCHCVLEWTMERSGSERISGSDLEMSERLRPLDDFMATAPLQLKVIDRSRMVFAEL
ncbi:MAG: hypothetical protein Q4B48_00530 [Syntrophomonadaceae bacterium]|nr:hypothetical protein [Syntrophomonadaceae bacterium]